MTGPGRSRGRGTAGALLCLFLIPSGPSLRAASHDNDVEWDGVYHSERSRSPHDPARNQVFAAELRVFHDDITQARVRTWDGSERFFSLARDRTEGIYDIWRGAVTMTTNDFLYYRFEVTDGSDTDTYNALGMWDGQPSSGDFLILGSPMGGYPLGATPYQKGTQSGVAFRVWAPDALTVSVAGDFNSWRTTANPLQNYQGFWEAQVPLAAPGQLYKFVINGSLWRADPRARRQENSVRNSVVAGVNYGWKDAQWRTPALEDLVIYELHIGSFSGDGDDVSRSPGGFRDAAEAHLDHLAALGVNAVELMPVSEFAGDHSWGYNPVFLYAPESAYGPPEDLKYLVDQCHRKGIAVIFDVVYNHMGPGDLQGNLLDFDGKEIYFYPQGNGFRETPWGPRPDYGRVEVQAFLIENARYWLEEFHGDGLRVDATDFIKVNAEGWRLLRGIVEAAREARPGSILIAEQLPNDPAVTRPIELGGAGFRSQWHDAFHDSLRASIGAAAFGDPDFGALASAVNHFGYPADQLVNYIESHDEAANQGRVCVAADPSSHESLWAQGRSRFAMALVLFSAGIPMLLQGQEFLEDRPFGDAEALRIQWSYVTRHAAFLRFARDAVHLRRTNPALRATAGQDVFHVNEGANLLAIHRWSEGEDLVVVLTLSNQDLLFYQLGFPAAGAWYEVLNGDSSAYGGQDHGNGGRIQALGPPLHGFSQSARIIIPRMGVLVFSRSPKLEGFVRGDSNGDKELNISDPIGALGSLFLGVDTDCPEALDSNGDGLFNITDPISLLAFLFTGGSPPKAPWPDCGEAPPGSICSRKCE